MTSKVNTTNGKTMRRAGKLSAGRLPILILLSGMLYILGTLAQPTGPNSVNPGASERGDITNQAQQVNAQAGNVTNINIDATTITQAWQGYYGNITGSITLEDSSGAVFYNWTGLGSISGEVYASRNDSITWGSVNCSNNANITAENSYLGKAASDPDSVNGTFSQLNHPEFLIGTRTIANNTCPSTNAFSGSGQDTSRFYQVLLNDASSNMVYTTIIDQDQQGFDGSTYDFELLVGENGNSTSQGVTTYYFYIELS